VYMARKRLKISDSDVREAMTFALQKGAMSIGDACKAIRAMKGLSQEAFASSIGLSLKVIKEIESGIANPKLSSLQRLAEAADLKVVFAAPSGVVRLGDLNDRVSEKKSSRERDFDMVSGGFSSSEKVNAVNSLGIGSFSYDLPEIF
ncbi:MAG: helix-turn-helix domain-containing protein, partial [Acidiferrobacterales bacterium]